MKKFIIAALLVPFTCSVSFGQHSDLEFGYDDYTAPTTIIIESDELTSDNIQIVEGELTELGGEVFADNPGFITIATEEVGGERVNAGDAVSVKFLDATQHSVVGVGYVNFYDPTTGELSTVAPQQFTISNQGGATSQLTVGTVVNDTILLSVGSDGTTESNSPDQDPDEDPEILGEGEIHNHLLFTLDQDVTGAYGLLFQFESVPANGGPTITSDPVWLIFNNGMDDDAFEDEAVAAFSAPFILGDIDGSGAVDFLDIGPFIDLLSNGTFQAEGDIDGSTEVDFLDIGPFIDLLSQ